MKLKALFIGLIFILSIGFVFAALDVAFADQGTGVKDKSSGDLINGSLTVEIWDSETGGNLIYNESFSDAIVDGSWSVLLGENSSNPLSLEFGKKYWKDYKINGEDVDFRNLTGDLTERRFFFSSLGDVSGEDINEGTNLTLNSVNATGTSFFTSLGEIANRITSIFVQDVNVSNTLNVSGNTILNGNLTIDSTDLFVDSNNNKVGIGLISPSTALDVNGTISVVSGNDVCIDGGACLSSIEGNGSSRWNVSGSNLFPENLGYNLGIGTSSPNSLLEIQGDGSAFDIQNSTGISKFFVNSSSGNVGIGTSSPQNTLNVNGDINATGLYYGNGSQLTNVGVPEGAIMAFDSATCPDGWVLADGNSAGTPDLRGLFLRGAGTNAQIGGGTYSATLGNYQTDQNQQHRHYTTASGPHSEQGASGDNRYFDFRYSGNNFYSSYSGGTESRPANYATIFCVKTAEDTPSSSTIWGVNGDYVVLNNQSKTLSVNNHEFLAHIKANSGVSVTGGTWNTLPYDFQKINTINGASFNTSTNRLTLPAGTYMLDIQHNVYATNDAVLRLYDPINSQEIKHGTVGYSSGTASGTLTIRGTITLSNETTMELQLYPSVGSTWGAGVVRNNNVPYSDTHGGDWYLEKR